jgi:hypothetical protein
MNCDATYDLQIAVACCAGFAALLWLLSSIFGLSSFMDVPIGHIDRRLRRQTWLNSGAAFFAALAAAGQAFLIKMPNCASDIKLSALMFLYF